MQVRDRNAVFERDSVLYYERDINYYLIAHLFRIAIENNNSLKVIDFGGSLGSTFYQHRDFFSSVSGLSVSWTVMEQKHFVEFGKENLGTDSLDFCLLPDDARLVKGQYNVVLLSSVLQYIKDWRYIFDFFIDTGVPNIIIERTPVGRRERIWVETVREPIYNATYACRMFNQSELIDYITDRGYRCVDEWHSLVDIDQNIDGDIAILCRLYSVND